MTSLHRLLLCCVVLLSCVFAACAKETYVFDCKFGSRGGANGQFAGNAGLAVASGVVAVADCDNHRIQLFDTDGNYQSQFGGVTLPYMPVIVPGGFYVLSYGSSNVTIHNSSGLVMGSMASAGSGPQQIDSPRGLALNPATNMLYIADTSNNRISQWTTGGVFVRTFGTEGTGDGQLKLPYGVALDASGNVYVADMDNHRIQKFSSTGDYLAKWPVGTNGEVGVPKCLTVSGNHVFVGSTTGMKVIKYTTDGAFVCQFGSAGIGNGQFRDLNGIAVDSTGRVFVSDGNFETSRVQRFVPNNTPTAPTTVAITPKPARDADNLTPKPLGATDPDGDPLTYRYQWYKSTNNVNWVKGPARRVLIAANTTVGEYWRVRVVAWDGKSASPAKVSNTVRIAPDLAPAMTAAAQATANGVGVTLSLVAAANVQVTVSNLGGRQIAVLPVSSLAAGVSTLHWNRLTSSGTKAAGGRYLLRATAKSSDGAQSSATCWINLR